MNNASSGSSHAQPRRRAASSGISLSPANAAIVKGMLLRGDRQSDIAHLFSVNPGRIAEIATGDRFATVVTAKPEELPAPGPYVTSLTAGEVANVLATARAAIEQAELLLGHRRK
jgi:hypothetical protein